jgi:transcriptional regulator with XRE-family HTH domain
MDLKTLRGKLKLTQAAAANLLGISVTTWSRWETGANGPDCRHASRILLLEEAADMKPCPKSPSFAFTKTPLTLEHIKSCPACRFTFLRFGDSVVQDCTTGKGARRG